MDSFCNVFLKKRFIKCISKEDNKCYLFVGRIPFIRKIINKIKKNKKEIGSDYFKDIDEEDINRLYKYLIPHSLNDEGAYFQKEYLKKAMFLDHNELTFVNESMNEDDTNETIINKIIYNCYSDKEYITPQYLYAWYYDNKRKKNLPISFEYEEESIDYDDFYEEKGDKYIDTSFINGNGDKMPKQLHNKQLTLFEKSFIKDDVIFFHSLGEYLNKVELIEQFKESSEDEIKGVKELRKFVNGLLLKYWPENTLLDILQFYEERNILLRKIDYEKTKERLDIYNRHLYIIESEFLSNNVNEQIKCNNYTLTILKLNKVSTINNTVHLSKLFSEFKLTNEVPFMKLLLNSHDDAFYKLYENSLMYEGSDKKPGRYITKDLCKEWSDGYNIQTEYGYRYLHSGNIILFKVYNIENDIYSTLIIHLNGDIECIIENNMKELRENEVKIMINDCNSLLSKINMDQFYAFKKINTLDTSVLSNVNSETKVDFINCGILFNKEDFQGKDKRKFPNWDKLLSIFIQNFPMYIRSKTIDETDEESKIIGRYNRVDNYANITTIQSAIAAYKIIYEDPEIIIQKLSKDYGKNIDFIRNEYETWEELMSMKEDRRKTTVINEGGSEIKIWLNTKEDLLIEIKNLKSFQEQRRLIMFIKTMLKMYLSYILKPKTALQRRLFEGVDTYVDEVYEEGVKEEEEEESIQQDESISLSDSDLSDELNQLEELEDYFNNSDDDIDFDDVKGGSSSEGEYETKSYYLKRLKEYDPELFKFKTRKKQVPSGAPYGYPKLCGAIDHRQPIAVTNDELKVIDESYEFGSGRESYSNAISVPRRKKNIKYICPKYWDISKSLSIRPDAVDHSNIVPAKLAKGSNGRTTKSILERSAIYWTDANDVEYYFPDITEDSKRLHPMGYGLPCCFNASKILKGDPEKKRKKKEEFIGEGYISNKDPVAKDKYAFPHPNLLDYFGQSEKTFTKKKGEGFLRIGVQQNDNDYIFPHSPFLQSYFKVVSQDIITEEGFLDIIEDKLKNNLDRFQKCPIIHQKFRKGYQNITEEDNQFIIDVLDLKNTENHFSSRTIHQLREEIRNGIETIKSNETSYLYQLLLSLKNYIDFLRSDENRNDKYILPILLHLNEINIVIFENKNDEIKIKISDYTHSNKFGFIYQRGNYYEPMLYRYYDDSDKEIKEIYQFTPDLINNSHYEIILEDIHQKVKKNTKKSKIDEYEKVIESMDDKLTTLMIDSYSNVSYLITKKEKVIPITPEPIPAYKNYNHIYSFLEINSIQVGMDVRIGPPKRRIKGKINSLPFGKKGREKVSILSTEGKEYPSVLCRNICFLDNKFCRSLLPQYKKAIDYLSAFKEYFTITSLLESEEGNVTTIMLSNNTYLPIIEEEINSSIPRDKGCDILQIENSLYRIKNDDDKRELFIKKYNYEEYITKLAIQHILSKVEEDYILVTGFIKDASIYKEGERLHFTYKDKNINGNKLNFIYKLDKLDHIYSQFESNYSIDGTVKEIKESRIKIDKYPNLSEVIMEVRLIDKISFVLNDPIMIVPHKKFKIYETINNHINPLFHILSEKDYQTYELDRYITLCNEKNELCNYPCTNKNGTCKLYIKEKDNYGKLLIEKIKWKFIEKITIHGINNRERIIEETINLNELSKTIGVDEIFYTFSDYKNDILNDVFTRKSKYILHDSNEVNIKKSKSSFMKKLDTIPYYIQKLFGMGSSVVFHLNKDNNDFISLVKALNESGIDYNVETMKDLLIEGLELNNRPDFLKKYMGKYKNISEIIEKIKGNTYHLQPPDFELIIRSLNEKDHRIGIIIISQEGNKQKKNNIYFYSTNLDIMDIETVPIISFHKTLYNEEYILSNILVDYEDELNYYTTIRDLYDKNPVHKKWIKIGE